MQTQPHNGPRVLRVEHPQAIKFLTNVDELRYLKPFIGHHRSLSAVARELKVDLSGLTRKVKRMIEMGLLELIYTEIRSGRPVKRYASSADEFFLPETTGAIHLLLVNTELVLNQKLAQALTHFWMNRTERPNNDWGLRVFREGDAMCARLTVDEAEDWSLTENESSVLHEWQRIKVSRADAKWYSQELQRLTQELKSRERADETVYLLRLAFLADLPE
jgi:hypothetical protein